MRKLTIVMTCLLLAGAVGCSRAKLKTREIHFYRADDVNGGQPIAIDIIYPRDVGERDKVLNEVGAEKWFTSELYDKVFKDKVWLDERSEVATLAEKTDDDEFMIIFAEFSNPDPTPPRSRETYLYWEYDRKPKARKREYVYVHEGSLQRLDGKKEARKMARGR